VGLFKAPTNAEGTGFYTPTQMGMFKGTLIALEPTTRNKFGTVDTPEPAVRWRWKFQQLDGTDIIDPATGECAIVDARTSTSLHKRSTGRPYMEAHIGRAIEEGEDPDALADEALGKEVMIQIAPNQATPPRLAVKSVLPFFKVGS
jgi:hypothetical protein